METGLRQKPALFNTKISARSNPGQLKILCQILSAFDTKVVPLDTKSVPLDTKVAPLDTKSVPLDTKLVPLDTKSVRSDAKLSRGLRVFAVEEKAWALVVCKVFTADAVCSLRPFR